MASSKASQTTRNIIIAFLALWSIISLIIIVVWATSPDMKGASQCRAELRAAEDKFKLDKTNWIKDRQALETMVRQGWDNQTLLVIRIEKLKEQLQRLNLTVESAQQENVILRANITLLQSEIEVHKATEANLTAEISQQQELIDFLQHNLTQTLSDLETCSNLRTAANLLQKTAEKQRDSCQTSKQYLQKQITKCKNMDHPNHHISDPNDAGPFGPRSGYALVTFLFISVLLIPCK